MAATRASRPNASAVPTANTAAEPASMTPPRSHSARVHCHMTRLSAACVRPNAASRVNETTLEPSRTVRSKSSTDACMRPVPPPPDSARKPANASASPAAATTPPATSRAVTWN